jgi:hypothetical protein
MPMSAGFDGMGLGLDENSQHYFATSHHMRQEFGNPLIDGRRMSQPDLQLYAEQRPITPAQQTNTGNVRQAREKYIKANNDRTMASDASYYTIQADTSSPGILKIGAVLTNEATFRPNDSSSLPNFHATRPIA